METEQQVPYIVDISDFEAMLEWYRPDPDPIVGIDCLTGEDIRESDLAPR